jgi:cytochrome P450
VREVLVDKASSFDKGKIVQRVLGPALGQGILTAENEFWRWQRRAAAPVFRHEKLHDFIPAMLEAAERTRQRWLALQLEGQTDVAHEMMRTTFDIIVETMLSGSAGLDVGRVEQAITDYLDATSWTIALTLLRAPDWVPHPGRKKARRARNYLRAETLRIVAKRRDPAEERKDLIALLLAARDPETGRSMDDREVADNLLTFITAGHETTALALTWAFYLLSQHPDVEAKVLEEITAASGKGPVNAAHIPKLVYTRQVISEALRLYPPVPLINRTATERVAVGEYVLEAGTPVYVPIYAIQRHRQLWSEPERFDPDRFAPEATRARSRYAYMPFGAGPRICIGASFAILEAVAILAIILPTFRLTVVTEPKLKMRVTLRPSSGMPMRIDRR